MRSRTLIAAGLAVAAIAAGEPSAHAAVVVKDNVLPDSGPVIAGEFVAWTQSDRAGSARVRAAVPGHQATTVFQQGRAAGSFGSPFPVGSPDGLAIVNNVTDFERRRVRVPILREVGGTRRRGHEFQRIPIPTASRDEVFSAAPGLQLDLRSTTTNRVNQRRCRRPYVGTSIAVGGPDLLTMEVTTPCTAGRLRYRDSTSRVLRQSVAGGGTPVEIYRADAYLDIQAEGDVMAVVDFGDVDDSLVRVIRRGTGEVLTERRIAVAGGIDVQADGTLAYVTVVGSGRRARLAPAVLAPGDVEPRILATGAISGSVKISGNRLAFGTERGDLMVTDLNGSGGVVGRRAFDGFDLSPERVTWSEFGRHGGDAGRILAQDL